MDLDRFDLRRYLATVPLFAGLDAAALQRLVGACRLSRLARHDMLFHAGERCATLQVLVTGHVKLFALSASGQEKVIELAGPGSTLAEAPLFSGQPHPLGAQALTDGVLLDLDKACVLAEIGSDSRFALRMLASVSGRLGGLLQDVEAEALHSGLQRVIGFLLRHHRALHDEVGAGGEATVSLPVSKATIASRLSLTPEYLSRVLRTLQVAGLIRLDKRDIRILDAGRLERQSRSDATAWPRVQAYARRPISPIAAPAAAAVAMGA